MARKANPKSSNDSPLGLEAKLWQAADNLSDNMDAAEYKHVVLGPLFLKYVSDSFEEHHAKLTNEVSQGATPKTRTSGSTILLKNGIPVKFGINVQVIFARLLSEFNKT